MASLRQKLTLYSRLLVLPHSVFALPFGLWGFALGVKESGFSWSKFLLVLGAIVTARIAAMAFNRYVDRRWDAQNPRTQGREIPQGHVTPSEALFLSVGASLAFVLLSWFLNPLCGLLSPIALFILLGYSFTKRFTSLSHYVLGLALGLAPVGAFLAVTGAFQLEVILIGLSVLWWVGGFDILYALQDLAFDRQAGLYSVPAQVGERQARLIALGTHLLATFLLAWVGWRLYEAKALYWVGWGGFTLSILRQHWVAREISRIDRAFFTHNGFASIVLSAAAIGATFL